MTLATKQTVEGQRSDDLENVSLLKLVKLRHTDLTEASLHQVRQTADDPTGVL